MLLEFAADYAGWIVAIVGCTGTVTVIARRLKAKARKGLEEVGQVKDVLLGRPAILHPDTGEVLVPETTGIGTRMAHIEQWQTDAGEILTKMADTQAEMVRTNARVDLLDDKVNRHIETCIPGSTQHVEIKVDKQT